MQVDFSKYQKEFKPWKLPNGGEFTDYSHIVNFFSHFIVGIKPGKKCQSFRAFCHDDNHNSLLVNFSKGISFNENGTVS